MIRYQGIRRSTYVLREAHKVCMAMSVTLSKAAGQISSEDTLILVQSWYRRCSDWSFF